MRSFSNLIVLAVFVGTLLIGAHPGAAADKWNGPSITVKYLGYDIVRGERTPQWEVTGRGFGPPDREYSVIIYVRGTWCNVFDCRKYPPNSGEEYLEVWLAQITGSGEEFCWAGSCGLTGTFRARIQPFYLCYSSLHAFDTSHKQHLNSLNSNEVRLERRGGTCENRLGNHEPPGSTIYGPSGQLMENPLRPTR